MSSSTTPFHSLGLSQQLVTACRRLRIVTPTHIQRLAIPAILRGQHVSARSPTGTGKTAAFTLPILQSLCSDPYGVYAVVLTPARELAMQIAEQIEALGFDVGVQVAVVVGGLNVVEQTVQLGRRPHFIVATPGRLAQLVRAGSLDFDVITKHVKFLVLDEADRLLKPEFAEDLRSIASVLPKNRQTLLFSATLSDSAHEEFCDKIMGDTKQEFQVLVTEDNRFATISKLDQRYMFMPEHVKDGYLLHCIEAMDYEACIVFMATCMGVQEVSMALKELEIDNVPLHSGLSQDRRLASLGKFREGVCKVLIATDVASRGLDIPEVGLVLNYDVPRSPEDYVHRVGRTARAGRGGKCITLVSQFDVKRYLQIERFLGKKMTEEACKDDDIADLMKRIGPARKLGRLRCEEILNQKGNKSSILCRKRPSRDKLSQQAKRNKY